MPAFATYSAALFYIVLWPLTNCQNGAITHLLYIDCPLHLAKTLPLLRDVACSYPPRRLPKVWNHRRPAVAVVGYGCLGHHSSRSRPSRWLLARHGGRPVRRDGLWDSPRRRIVSSLGFPFGLLWHRRLSVPCRVSLRFLDWFGWRKRRRVSQPRQKSGCRRRCSGLRWTLQSVGRVIHCSRSRGHVGPVD